MESGKAITDQQRLIAACKKGELKAQKRVYELYSPAMMALCVRYVSNRETARDLLQDGFVKLFGKIDSYSGIGSFEGWIRRIFITTALEYLRQNDALKLSDSIDEFSLSLMDTDLTVLEKLSADDLMDCISRLADGYRTVFNLYAIEGYTHNEIAEMLGISESTSRSQFMRARKILQKEVLSYTGQENAKRTK